MARTVAEGRAVSVRGNPAMRWMEVPDVRAPGGCPASAQEVKPMQTLRASLVAIPFVVLAVVVAALSALIGPAQ